MSNKAPVAIAAAALLAAVYWLLSSRSAPPPDTVPGLPVAATGEGSAQPASAAGSIRPPGPARPASRESLPAARPAAGIDPRHLAGFKGRLVLRDVGPGARLSLSLLSVDPMQALVEELDMSRFDPAGIHISAQRAESDASGAFELRGVRPRDTFVLSIGERTEWATSLRLEQAPRGGETVDLGEIVLERKPSLVGRVVDPAGAPVEGAFVMAPAFRDGRTRPWANLGTDLRADLFDPRGYLLWQCAEGTGGMIVMRMPAWVETLLSTLQLACARTDKDGRFELNAVESIASLTAAKPGFWPVHRMPIHCKENKRYDLGDLALGAGRTVRGRVVEADGTPVAGAELLIGPRAFRAGLKVHLLQDGGVTGADGEFAIGGQAEQPCFVAVKRRGATEWCATGPHAPSAPIEIRLSPGLMLDVHLAGAERPGIQLKLMPGHLQGELLTTGLVAPVRSASLAPGQSRWRAERLHPGPYTLLAAGSGMVPQVQRLALDADATVTVDMPPAADLEVLVVDAKGQPVPGTQVFAHPAAEPEWAKTVLDGQFDIGRWRVLPSAWAAADEVGCARLSGLPYGEVRVTACHPGFGTTVASTSVPGQLIVVTLQDCGTLECSVLSEGKKLDKPMGIEVRAVDRDPADAPASPRLLTTGPDGTFTLAGLTPGKYEVAAVMDFDRLKSKSALAIVYGLSANRAVSGERAARRFEIRAGKTTEVYLELQPQFAAPDEPRFDLFGAVTINGGSGEGRIVRVWQFDAYHTRPGPGKFQPLETKVAADGSYRIVGIKVPTESKRVLIAVRSATTGIGLASDLNVTVPDDTRELRRDFAIETGSLDGDVVDEEGNPVKCTLGFSGGVSIASDADGRFSVEELPAKEQMIQVFAKSGVTNLRNQKVAPGKNHLRITHYSFVRVAGTVDLRAIHAPGDLAITVSMHEEGGAFNYVPMGQVDKQTGRFEIEGEPVMAGEYEFRIYCNGQWFRHPEKIKVYPGKASELRLTPVACEPPAPPGPGLFAPQPPLKERPKGADGKTIRPMLGPGFVPLDTKGK